VSNRVEFISRRGWRVCLWVLFSGFTALGLVFPVLNAAPQENEKLSKAEKRRQKAIQRELESPYKKWLNEEVPYIITSEERASFKKFTTDDERDNSSRRSGSGAIRILEVPRTSSKRNTTGALPTQTSTMLQVSRVGEPTAGESTSCTAHRTRMILTPAAAPTFDLRKRVAARPPHTPSSNGGIVILTASGPT